MRSALPPVPARVLEVGAGNGELAGALRTIGYDVLAIDPASDAATVTRVALRDVEAPPASFDAAIAVVSLHHVAPLEASCARLGQLVRAGGALVVDEFDLVRFDEAAAGWLLRHAKLDAHERREPAQVVAELRHHLHDLRRIRRSLEAWFDCGPPARGPYLYRWDLPDDLRAEEERQIASGALPATGARFVATRRDGAAVRAS